MKMNKSVLQRGIIFILCIYILFSICPVYAFAAGNQKEKIIIVIMLCEKLIAVGLGLKRKILYGSMR